MAEEPQGLHCHDVDLICTSLLQWVTVGDVDVDIGANPSAEEEEDNVDSQSRKVVDVVDAFRLNVRSPFAQEEGLLICAHAQRALH